METLRKVLLCAHLAVFSAMAQNVTVFASGLQKPLRLVFTPQGNLLVSEGGLPESNTGRVSILDRGGARRSLLEGLPTARGYTLSPYGPTSMALDGDTLYLLIGEGDVEVFGQGNLHVNPDGPSSPIFSTILKIQFSAEVDRLRGSFQLTSPGDWALLDGYEVNLENSVGERAKVQLLTAFRPIVRNVLGGSLTYRQSNPYGVSLDARNRTLWLTDAGMETVIKVDTNTGRSQVLFRFEPYLRSTAAGPVPVDNVPTGACLQGDQLLVGLFTAAQITPVPEGEASIWSIDTRSRAARPTISGLNGAVDILCGAEGLYVLEDLFSRTPPITRVSVYQGGSKRVLADVESAALGAGMAQDPVSGAIYFARLGFGDAPSEIVRVATR
jgi:hypothetical protein